MSGYYSIASQRFVPAAEVKAAESAKCGNCGKTYHEHGFCDVCPDESGNTWRDESLSGSEWFHAGQPS